jgi:uncharacterized protein YbjT (DUF2867 family)
MNSRRLSRTAAQPRAGTHPTETYLITGATGNVGSLVVEHLIGRGNRPRVFVRDGGKAKSRYGARVDVFVGDLSDATTLGPALEGADALLLINSGPDLAGRDQAAAVAAKAAKVKLLVKLSSFDSRELGVGTGVWHLRGESAIRASGVPFTFVQPSGFMDNALFWAKSIKAEGVVRAATGGGRIAFIHSRDIAEIAAKALTTREFVGESLAITGPEALSYAEMAAKIGARIGKAVTFHPFAEERVREEMGESGEGPEVVGAHLSIYRAIREGRLSGVTDTVERLLGRKPIPFDQWVEENAAAFR